MSDYVQAPVRLAQLALHHATPSNNLEQDNDEMQNIKMKIFNSPKKDCNKKSQ